MSILSLQQLQTFRDIKESISSQLRPSISYLASEVKDVVCVCTPGLRVCVCVLAWMYVLLNRAAIVPSEMTVGIFVLYISYYGCMNT